MPRLSVLYQNGQSNINKTLHASADGITHLSLVLLIFMLLLGTVPVIGLYEVKVGKLSEASNKKF